MGLKEFIRPGFEPPLSRWFLRCIVEAVWLLHANTSSIFKLSTLPPFHFLFNSPPLPLADGSPSSSSSINSKTVFYSIALFNDDKYAEKSTLSDLHLIEVFHLLFRRQCKAAANLADIRREDAERSIVARWVWCDLCRWYWIISWLNRRDCRRSQSEWFCRR